MGIKSEGRSKNDVKWEISNEKPKTLLHPVFIDHAIANFFRNIGILQVRLDGMWEQKQHVQLRKII